MYFTLESALPASSEHGPVARWARPLAPDERAAVARAAHVRFSSRHSFASLLAVAAARRLGAVPVPRRERIGVISTGGPGHLEPAWDLSQTIASLGPGLLDPLRFPHAIPSATATCVASACEARAFAFAIGHDRCAFIEALATAAKMVRHGFADGAYVVAAHDASGPTGEAMDRGGMGPGVDAAICAFLSREPMPAPCLRLLKTSGNAKADGPNDRDGLPPGETARYRRSATARGPREDWDAFTACGAVLLMSMAERARTQPPDQSNGPFRVLVEDDERRAWAVAQWRPGPER